MSVQPEETVPDYGDYEFCTNCHVPLKDSESTFGECDACIWAEVENASTLIEINSDEDFDEWLDRMLRSDWTEDDEEED